MVATLVEQLNGLGLQLHVAREFWAFTRMAGSGPASDVLAACGLDWCYIGGIYAGEHVGDDVVFSFYVADIRAELEDETKLPGLPGRGLTWSLLESVNERLVAFTEFGEVALDHTSN